MKTAAGLREGSLGWVAARFSDFGWQRWWLCGEWWWPQVKEEEGMEGVRLAAAPWA